MVEQEMQRTARERLIQKSVVGKDLQQQTDEAHAQPPSPYLARQSPPSPASQHQQQLQPERAATVSSGRTSRSPLLTSAAQLPAGAASKAKPPPPPPHSAQSSLGAGSSSAGSLKTPQQQPEPSLAPASRPASSLSTTEWQIRVMSLQSEIETLRKDKIALESQLRQLGHQPVTSLKSSPSPDPHSSVAQTGEQPQTDATPAESTGPDKASSGTPGEQAPEGASSAGQVWKEIKTLSTAIMQKLGVEQQSVAVLPKQPPDQTPAPIQPVDSSLAPVDTDETAKQQEARPASTTADSQVASPSQLPTSQPSIVAREQHTPSLSDKAAPAKPTVARKPASLSGTSASTTSSGNSKLPFAHQHSTAASLASQTTTAAPSSTPSPAQTSAPASAPAPAPAQAPTSVVPVADTTARIPDLPKKPAPSLNAAKAAADDLPKKRTEPAVSSNAVLPKDDPVDLGTEFKSDLLNIMGSFGF
ncbi:hypothetical protein HK105_205974 [Polyrhizophydium stewartii]|uniref:Uncharacterized protein n=1 Tax=Polyrhizophydium stewartii TaxID=2732419 RepID=A0ABR4N4D6_9FUNG